MTHISVFEHERAMFHLTAISSIHRSRLCRTNCHFHTVHCAINLPVSPSDFKAHKQMMIFDGIPTAKCRRAQSGIHQLKEKLFLLQRTPPLIRRRVRKFESAPRHFKACNPQKRGYNGIYGSNWIFVHRDQHRAHRLNSSIINGYTRFFNYVIYLRGYLRAVQILIFFF